MEISEIKQNDLELKCVGIITQCLADLGQKDNDAEHKVMLARSLARDTELFVLSAATWCKWLNTIKREVWEAWHHFELGNSHVIQKPIMDIMKKQPKLLIEYKKKLNG